jgi:hypothetical protein
MRSSLLALDIILTTYRLFERTYFVMTGVSGRTFVLLSGLISVRMLGVGMNFGPPKCLKNGGNERDETLGAIRLVKGCVALIVTSLLNVVTVVCTSELCWLVCGLLVSSRVAVVFGSSVGSG